jgi:hypothetical protein
MEEHGRQGAALHFVNGLPCEGLAAAGEHGPGGQPATVGFEVIL